MDTQNDDFATCVTCGKQLVWGDAIVNLYVFAQTSGVRPRQRSESERISFCPCCAIALAHGPMPQDRGMLYVSAWGTVRTLIAADPTLGEIAYKQLNKTHRLLADVIADVATGQLRAG